MPISNLLPTTMLTISDLNHADIRRWQRKEYSTSSRGAHVAWNAGTTLTLSAYHDIIFESGSNFQ